MPEKTDPPSVERYEGRLLAIDTGSPTTSVALGTGDDVTLRELEQRRTSELLLPTIEELLAERGWRLGDLDGLIALAGPGSFTGLRIGLATIYGLHQSTGIRATAIPTLDVLAAASGADEVTAAVDSLRGEWLAAPYRDGTATAEPRLVAAEALVRGGVGPGPVIGAGVKRLEGAEVELLEPPELASVALAIAADGRAKWDPLLLTRPLYARPPATTPPGRPKTVAPA